MLCVCVCVCVCVCTPLTWNTAWERDDVALASVGCWVRFMFPLSSMLRISSAALGCEGRGAREPGERVQREGGVEEREGGGDRDHRGSKGKVHDN